MDENLVDIELIIYFENLVLIKKGILKYENLVVSNNSDINKLTIIIF